jgi:hypothetical protein
MRQADGFTQRMLAHGPAPLPPGIYLARLAQGANQATARIVIVR